MSSKDAGSSAYVHLLVNRKRPPTRAPLGPDDPTNTSFWLELIQERNGDTDAVTFLVNFPRNSKNLGTFKQLLQDLMCQIPDINPVTGACEPVQLKSQLQLEED